MPLLPHHYLSRNTVSIEFARPAPAPAPIESRASRQRLPPGANIGDPRRDDRSLFPVWGRGNLESTPVPPHGAAGRATILRQ